MIFLLNYERVRFEVTELTRHRMAQVLKVSPTDIEVAFEKGEDGEVSSGWTVKSLPDGVTPERAREVCVAVARWMRTNYLAPRLIEARQTAREARGDA